MAGASFVATGIEAAEVADNGSGVDSDIDAAFTKYDYKTFMEYVIKLNMSLMPSLG